MKEILTIIYTLIPENYAQMMQFHYSFNKKYFWLRFIVLLLSLYTLYVMLFGLSLQDAFVVILLITVLIFALKPWIQPWFLRRQFYKQKLLQNTRTMYFEEEGFRYKTDKVDGFIKYKAIEKIRANDRFILLYLSSNQFHFVPLNTIEEKNQINLLWELLEQKVEDTSLL